jgi:bifunctional non-homologous end joining protein LigD
MSILRLYNAKRDFNTTPEPRAGTRGERGVNRRFVVQRHEARRLHYDFRLELGGVYKSWAVTKTPSLNPATRRLAIAVEDHPLAYGTFEGRIPKGQYGGGIVQLWDRGCWTPQNKAAPAAALRKGHLGFVLNGKRMKGGWALIRLQGSRWLLVKMKDAQARSAERGDALGRLRTSIKTGRTLKEIGRHGKPKRQAKTGPRKR